MSKFVLFLLAILFFIAGQWVRGVRWRLLLENPKSVKTNVYITSLCIGGIINSLIPWRLGEIVRIFYFWKRTHCRVTPLITSVVGERIIDILSTIILFICFSVYFGSAYLHHSYILIILFSSICLFFLLVMHFTKFRKIIYYMSSIFNVSIQTRILEIISILISYYRNKIILSKLFFLFTSLMWMFYILAYCCISYASNLSFIDIFILYHKNPLSSMVVNYNSLYSNSLITAFIITNTVPLLCVVFYGLVVDNFSIFLNKNTGNNCDKVSFIKVPSHFISYADYKRYLHSFFLKENSAIKNFADSAIPNALVVRILSGGSDAIVAIIQENNFLIIRKYAQDCAQKTLIEQVTWLKKQKTLLPLVEVLSFSHDIDSFTYDMPHHNDAIDFYEFIHSSRFPVAKRILSEIYKAIINFHANTHVGIAKNEIISQYYHEKIKTNVEIIIDTLKTSIDLYCYHINGDPYSIKEWDFLLDEVYFQNTFSCRNMSEIHGDLTIENIIINNSSYEWYIIDPNPINIFNSPLLDFAKLFQSLHLGYEQLNKFITCSITDNNIRFISTKSNNYEELYSDMIKMLNNHFPKDILQQIYLHEIVHYLRLTPYKIRHNPEKGVLFFANTCILIREYTMRYCRHA